jgi:hypothetical protein
LIDFENCIGLNTEAGFGVTTLVIWIKRSCGNSGVGEIAGVNVIVGVSVMVGVSVIVDVSVIVGVRVTVGDGGKNR